jgi:hypothetical protein
LAAGIVATLRGGGAVAVHSVEHVQHSGLPIEYPGGGRYAAGPAGVRARRGGRCAEKRWQELGAVCVVERIKVARGR